MTWSLEQTTKKLLPLQDEHFINLKRVWYQEPQNYVNYHEFKILAERWFRSTKVNDIRGWDAFPCVDVMLGCTHFIEAFLLKYGWDGMQILPNEYAYYALIGGKHGTNPGELKPNVPLIVSLPNWRYAGLRPDWNSVLQECEAKNIDIHIDFAWLTSARNINIDLDHPNIKSFGMSMSKYALEWNRIGLRWSRQRTSDSITMFNHYYGDVNSNLTSCGAFMMKNISRDYGWENYGLRHEQICQHLGLLPTNLLHVAHNQDRTESIGIGGLLTVSPDCI